MIRLSHKSKQYLLAALKVLILAATFWYIYLKLNQTDAKTVAIFTQAFQKEGSVLLFSGLLFVALACFNWYFEILKWKCVVSNIGQISFNTALKQCLAAHTVSLATPNRVGDYGAKAMYYSSEQRKQILLLNFFNNGIQMLVTFCFGFFGLVYVWAHYDLQLSILNLILVGIVCLLLGALAYLFKEKELVVKGFSMANVMRYFNAMSIKIKLKTLIFALTRYGIFSFLFYRLLLFFDVTLPIEQILPFIFAMYLLVSIVPTLFIFDVVVRGGVAVWLFSLAGVAELAVLSTVLCMWILNFVLPALWGSYYVLTYKPVR